MVFETLLCILLYLGAIVSPGSYSYQEIDVLTVANQPSINQIHSNPTQEQAIVQEFSPQLEFLDIYDIYDE